MKGLGRKALGLGKSSEMWKQVGGWGGGRRRRRVECWPCLQLATPGNPQAKVNPTLAETRTQGDKSGKIRGRETEPVVIGAWD